MDVDQILEKAETGMEKALEFTKNQFAKVRTGRANASLVDTVRVDYYGAPTPISQVANISVPDARTIMIQPYDQSVLGEVDKAIKRADLGFNPLNDGNVIRIPVPPLTEERRKDMVKLSKKYAEEGKISIRNVRRDCMDMLKKGEKNKDFSEDDKKFGEDEVQNITDKYVENIDKELEKKEKELMDD